MPPPATQSLTHLHHPHAHHHAAPPAKSDPVQLAHFVIFNPTLIPPKHRKRNKVDDELTESTPRSLDHSQTPLSPPSSRSDSDPSAHVTAPNASEPVLAGAAGNDGKSGKILESSKNPNPDDGDVASKAPNNDASNKSPNEEDNPDLEDDLREAAQIVFYTSHQAGRVSRDTMLRQVGLAKGLMGFTDMAAPSRDEKNVWAVHGSHSRMIVYAPLPDWYMYICIKSADTGVHGLSDQMLVAGLERGYHDFCVSYLGHACKLIPVNPRFLRQARAGARFRQPARAVLHALHSRLRGDVPVSAVASDLAWRSGSVRPGSAGEARGASAASRLDRRPHNAGLRRGRAACVCGRSAGSARHGCAHPVPRASCAAPAGAGEGEEDGAPSSRLWLPAQGG